MRHLGRIVFRVSDRAFPGPLLKHGRVCALFLSCVQDKGTKENKMKRLSIVACLAAIAIVFVGCQSMALKSGDANERMKAVKAITEQEELLEVTRNKDYKNDVRLDALQRLTKQRGIWRVWCENGENKEIAEKALDLLTEEDLLARVALLHSYEESAEEKEERESSEKKKGMAFGAAVLAVNAGGAAAASKANDAGGKAAADVGTKAANAGLAMAFSEQKEPEPNMAIRTNEALVAVGKLKTLPAISAVALNSTIESVQLNALRKFLCATKDVQMLKDVACEGCLRNAKVTWYRNLDGNGHNILRQNKIIAIRQIQDSAALTNVIDRGYGESRKYAFARLIQIKDFDVAAEMLCKYDIGTFLAVEGNRDISDANAAKLVARFPQERNCIKLALDAKSPAIAKVAVKRVKNESALLSIARKTSVFDIFKSAISRISDERSYEDIVVAGGDKSEYAIGLLKDTDYILMVFGKADKGVVRTALAKKIAEKDITAELCSNEKEGSIKRILFGRAADDVQLEVFASSQDDFRVWAAEQIAASRITVELCEAETHLPTRRVLRKRAPDEVKAELAKRRAEKIKKAVAIAERDGKELLELVATKKSDQIDTKKIATFFGGRLLFFKYAEIVNNEYTVDSGRKACFVSAEKPSAGNWNNNTPLNIQVMFEQGSSGVKELFSSGDKVSAGGIVRKICPIYVDIDGDVVAEKDGLGIQKTTHIFDLYDPDDVVLDSMLADSGKSPTVRYAESVGWEFNPQSAGEAKQDSPKSNTGKAARTIGDVVDTVKEVKEPKDQEPSKLREGGSQNSDAGETGKKETSDMKDALKKAKSSSPDDDLDSLLNSIDN